MESKKSYYEILGVDRRADENEIRQAYYELALENHPDLYPGNREKEEKMKIINEAYLILKNPAERAKYDLEIERLQMKDGRLNLFHFPFSVFHFTMDLWLDSFLKWNKFWFSPVSQRRKERVMEV